MKEYFSEAVVLDKGPSGETDERVFLYSEALGRVSAKISSGRKITSKLSPHLEPLNLVKVRLVYKNNFQVADVLRFGRLPAHCLKILRLVSNATPENHADQELWSVLRAGPDSASQVLTVLGFDPALAVCANCGAKEPAYFYPKDSEYFCEKCAGYLDRNDSVQVHELK